MSTYAFVARDTSGRVQRGELPAATPGEIATTLRGRGWSIVDIRADEADSATWTTQLARLHPREHLPPASFDVELSLLQLGVMLRGGLTLLAAVSTVGEQARRPTMARIWRAVGERVQGGSSFADALAEHGCFSRLVVQLVRVGEQTGNLEQVVGRAADILERRRALWASLLTALAYPAIVFFAAIGVTAFMVVGVIPKLQVFLSALGRRLPWMTQALLDFSTWVQVYGAHVAGGLLLLFGLAAAIYSWPPGRLQCDRVALRLPVIGVLFRLAATATLARSLGTLIRSGVTLLEGLRTVESLHANQYIRTRIAATRVEVLHGGDLAQPLRAPHAFMPMLGAMVAVGESTGTLDDVLDEVATFHEAQLQVAIRRFSLLIEPVVIVVVGGIVGFVYIAFFVALFSAAGSV